jgi:hypothetical protein
MTDTPLIKEGRSCTRSGGGPCATETRKVEGVQGGPRECGMSENNTTDAKRVDVLERILDSRNLQRAYDRVCANKGSAGIDGIGTDGLLSQITEMGLENLKEQIRKGKYRPQPVLRVEIPKEGGKTRNLGIPTVNSYCTSYSTLSQSSRVGLILKCPCGTRVQGNPMWMAVPDLSCPDVFFFDPIVNH